MWYVYVLQSEKNQDLYIGYSEDLKKRFLEHNSGLVTSTKAYKPWQLVYYESFRAKLDAAAREKQLKGHKAKSDLKIQIKHSIIGS